MMIRFSVCVFSVFFVLSVGCSRAYDYPEAKLTIKVVDEGGNPLEAVNVAITFELPKSNVQGIKDVTEKGITGTDGIFSGSSRTGIDIAYGAEKEGYYKSYGEYHFTTSTNGRWKPWNPEVNVILRKIINPVPMYARKLDVELPAIGKDVGFDLIKYDWIAPYGIGTTSDIIFHLEKQFKSKDDFEGNLTIKFENKFDGIQLVKEDLSSGSRFKLPRSAPESKYMNKLLLLDKRIPGKSIESNYSKDNNYIFRIRSEEKNGKFFRAMYGKIKSDISFDAMNSKTAFIVFDYYVNPDYTTNLEFDAKRNLFINFNNTDRVGP